jgi:hypothetical protein
MAWLMRLYLFVVHGKAGSWFMVKGSRLRVNGQGFRVKK